MRKLLSAFVLATALALPASALAEDFCVGSHPDCPIGASMESPNLAGLENAAIGANINIGNDRIYVAAGTYPIASGFPLSFADDVEIRGEGVGQTIFTSSISGQDFLSIGFPSSASFFEGFTILATGAHVASTGLDVSGGKVRDFRIDDQSAGAADDFTALELKDGANGSDFEVELESDGIGVSAKNGPATIDRTTLVGPAASDTIGIDVDNPVTDEVTVRRSTVRAFDKGFNQRSGKLTVSDVLVDLETLIVSDAFYLFDETINNSHIDVAIERVTVHGNATGQSAVFFGADGFGTKEFDGTIKDSVFELAGANAKALRCVEGAAPVNFPVDLSVTSVAYDHTFPVTNIDVGCTVVTADTIDLAGQPSQFENAAGDDFTPAAGSLLIDGGSSGSTLPGGALDLVGNTRLNDGNGDCTAKIDPGAFEFQLPPQPSCAPPTTPPTTTPPATPSPIATAKLTTRAKKAFVRSRSGFRKRTNPRATSFGITFKNAQVARFELEQSVPGVRKGGKCVAKGSGRRCNFFKPLKGIQRIDVTDGQRFFTFGGRFNGKRLKPGTYRAKITPFGEGGIPGQPISVPFKLR